MDRLVRMHNSLQCQLNLPALAKKIQTAAVSLGGTDVLSAEVQIVWLSTVAPESAPAPRAAPQSLTLVVLVRLNPFALVVLFLRNAKVVSLAIAAGVILLLAAIVACLALRKQQTVVVRSEPLLPGSWPQASPSSGSPFSQQMSVLSPPRLSTSYDMPLQQARPYTRLEDDQVLAALYAAAGASNPLARQ